MKFSKATVWDKVQPARWADLGQIYELQRRVFPTDAYPYFDMALLFLLPGMINLKALNPAGEVVGYISGAKTWLPRRPAWIVMIGVDQAWRQQGYGKNLLAACEALLYNPRIRLTVRASNTPAIQLYERVGYQQVAVRRRYYRGGEDGLIMEKRYFTS